MPRYISSSEDDSSSSSSTESDSSSDEDSSASASSTLLESESESVYSLTQRAGGSVRRAKSWRGGGATKLSRSASPIRRLARKVGAKAFDAMGLGGGALTRSETLQGITGASCLFALVALILLYTATYNPYNSYTLLPDSNVRKFLSKVNRPLEGLSHEAVWNTAIVELAKVYKLPVGHFHDLKKLNIDRLCDLYVHNGARLFLIREGIIGPDASFDAQYGPEDIRNMAVIEMEKVSGMEIQPIQDLPPHELDAFALQQMHVDFAYTTDGDAAKFVAQVERMKEKYKNGKPNATAAEIAANAKFIAIDDITGSNFDYDGKVELRQLSTTMKWYTKKQFAAMFDGSTSEWEFASEIGRYLPKIGRVDRDGNVLDPVGGKTGPITLLDGRTGSVKARRRR